MTTEELRKQFEQETGESWQRRFKARTFNFSYPSENYVEWLENLLLAATLGPGKYDVKALDGDRVVDIQESYNTRYGDESLAEGQRRRDREFYDDPQQGASETIDDIENIF